MHVTGFWSAVGAVITGLIVADLVVNWKGSTKLLGGATSFGSTESKYLAGK